ncbi:hypothetical protein LG293_15945 (plasmid) [Citricoccus nitrophenolicus]
MGSFSTTCGLTGLAISEGDRAGFVPLALSKHRYNDGGPIITDCTAFMAPAGAPVFGRYDSYGRLDDAEGRYTPGKLVADEDLFKARGMFFHARALEAITEQLAEDPFDGRRDIVLKHWEELTTFMAATPGNPIHEMYSQRRIRRGDPVADLLEMLQRATAWDPDDFIKLREMSCEQVADMVAIVDAASFMGRVIGPSGYINEGNEVWQIELTHQVAGGLLKAYEARADGVY